MKKRADHILQMVMNHKPNEQIDKENLPSSPSIIEDTPPHDQKQNWTNLLQIRSSNVCESTAENNADQSVVKDVPHLKSPRTRSSSSSTSSSSSSSSSVSTSSSSTSSSSSSNKSNTCAPGPSSDVGRRAAAVCKPNYHVSPINTDESDVDLSDNDPTFLGVNRNNCLVPASSSSSTSSCSSPKVDTDVPLLEDVEEQSSTKKSRKRKRNRSAWKQNMAKKLRNSGQAYTLVSKSKKVIPAQSMKPVCNCRLKCSDNIGDDDRSSLFENYWNLPDLEVQRAGLYYGKESQI